MLAAFGLFLATALFGRRLVRLRLPADGLDRSLHAGRALDRGRPQRAHAARQGAAGSRAKIVRKAAKHAAWLLIAFADRRRLDHVLQRRADRGPASSSPARRRLGAYFFVGLFTATTYLLAGLAREQVCTYMCPWPRIQGGVLDEDTSSSPTSAGAASRAASTRRARAARAAATASTATTASRSARPASTSATASSSNASAAACASMPATTSWTRIGRPRELITYDSERNQAAARRRPAAGHPDRPAAHPDLCRVLARWSASVMLIGLSAALERRRQRPARPQPAVRHPVRRQHPQRLHAQDPEQEPRRSGSYGSRSGACRGAIASSVLGEARASCSPARPPTRSRPTGSCHRAARGRLREQG